MSTTLEHIIAKLSEDVSPEKTASAPEAVKTAQNETQGSPEDTLLAKVREIGEKTAADLNELQKIAADVAEAESASMLEQAKLAGAALCDGFMERLAAYEGELAKTASTQLTSDVEKIAAEAYARGRADLEKEAQEAYAEGHEAALQEIHKIATDIHLAGQQSARNVLEALRTQAGEKTE